MTTWRGTLCAAFLLSSTIPAGAFYLEWYHECNGGLPGHGAGSNETMVVHVLNWLGDSTVQSGEPTLLQLEPGCAFGFTSCFTNPAVDPVGQYISVASSGCPGSNGLMLLRFNDAASCNALHAQYAASTTYTQATAATGYFPVTNGVGIVPVGQCLPANTIRDSGTPCRPQFIEHARATFVGVQASAQLATCNACGQTSDACPMAPPPPASPSASPSPTCSDLKAQYKASECCGASKDKALVSELDAMRTCGDVKTQYKAGQCCPNK